MNKWAVQDAKDQFSHVVDLARTSGPQTITKHGEPVAVMVAFEEYRKMQLPQETPLEFLSRFKGLNLKRSKELPRKTKL
jgi:prevent-host-death family protein